MKYVSMMAAISSVVLRGDRSYWNEFSLTIGQASYEKDPFKSIRKTRMASKELCFTMAI